MLNFSIIIPHYNIPNLLVRCLRSIPNRSDIQIIVVDDCSPGAKDYCRTIPELSCPGVELYSTPIGGSAGRARNIGLSHAKGNWLIFLDADDLLVDGASTIMDRIIGEEYDILFYNSLSVMSEDLNRMSDRNYYESFFSHPYDETLFRFHFHSLWGKVFNRSFIENNKIFFDETRYANDAFFCTKAGILARSVFIDDTPFYIVTQRDGSLASYQFGKQVISCEECKVRLGVSIKIFSYARKHSVDLGVGDISLFLSLMLKHHKREYFKTILKMIFILPSFTIPYLCKIVFDKIFS